MFIWKCCQPFQKNVLPEFIFLTALDDQKGFELAQIEDPDVIILDFDEAVTDDFSLCRRLKNDRALNSIPIVLLISPQTKTGDRNKAFQAGVDTFLSKPLGAGVTTRKRQFCFPHGG